MLERFAMKDSEEHFKCQHLGGRLGLSFFKESGSAVIV
jgi:hypothetical protein